MGARKAQGAKFLDLPPLTEKEKVLGTYNSSQSTV